MDKSDRNRIYVSGPMTGYVDLNEGTFRDAIFQLAKAGFAPINPHALNHGESKSWHEFMRTDIMALMKCDGVATLPGWQESRGATLEVHVAHAIGMPVMSVDRWLEWVETN